MYGLVLHHYLMCKRLNVFVPVWKGGYVFGLPSLWEHTSTRAGRPPLGKQLWWLSSQLILSLFHFSHLTVKHNKLSHMIMRCLISFQEACKSEFPFSYSRSSFSFLLWLLYCACRKRAIEKKIMRFGGPTTSKSCELIGGWDAANCLLAWWWLNVSLMSLWVFPLIHSPSILHLYSTPLHHFSSAPSLNPTLNLQLYIFVERI